MESYQPQLPPHERRERYERRMNSRFRGHDVLYAKYAPKLPQSAEREYDRLVSGYLGILRDALAEELPRLRETYQEEQEHRRNDAETDLNLELAAAFQAIRNRMTSKTDAYGMRGKLERLSHLTRKLSVGEWKKAVRSTLGIDIREDYYLGDFYRRELDDWVAQNVDLIKTIPHDALNQMEQIIYDGYVNGRSTADMMRDIQTAYDVSKRRARFIARDQVAKLNGQIQRAQQMDAGIDEYIWSTVGDERVRSSHRALNGHRFRWDEPPLNADGRACHPGEDFNCRCIARPIFRRDGLNLPVEDPNGFLQEVRMRPMETARARAAEVQNSAAQDRNMAYFMRPGGVLNAVLLRDYLKRCLTKAPESNKLLLEQMIESADFAVTNEPDVVLAYQGGEVDAVLYNPAVTDLQGFDAKTAMVHELAHRVDAHYVRSYNDPAFRAAVRDAGRGKSEAFWRKLQEYCEQNDKEGYLSDICGALCGGVYEFRFEHSADYWTVEYRKPIEVFANLFALETIRDQQKLNLIKICFPNVIKAYEALPFH